MLSSSSKGKRKGRTVRKQVDVESDSDWESMSSDEEDDDAAAIESVDDESLGSLDDEQLQDSDDGISDTVGRVKNSIKSRKASGKVVKADEYQYDSSDEEVR